jgi:hypothetical protein
VQWAILPFSPALRNSVSPSALDPRGVLETTHGSIDLFDWVDGLRGLIPRVGRPRVPAGAPLVVSGWAVDPTCDMPPAAIAIVIDAERVFNAEIGFDRTDVQALLGRQTPAMIGFRIAIDDNLPSGMHEMHAYALGSNGKWYQADHYTFCVYSSVCPERGTGTGSVRVKVDGAVASGRQKSVAGVVPLGDIAIVSGWALDLGTRVAPAGVYAMDQRGGRWSAPCDVPRQDVRISIGADTDILGFELAVPTGALELGEQKISLGAFDGAGRPVGRVQNVTFELAAETRPFPGFARCTNDRVDAMVLLTGSGRRTLLGPRALVEWERGEVWSLEGWALIGEDPSAQIFLELQRSDVVVPPWRYQTISGFRRKRPPQDLPRPFRDDAWFTYDIDTSDLTPGTYELGVAVVRLGRRLYARGELGSVRVVEPAGSSPVARRL